MKHLNAYLQYGLSAHFRGLKLAIGTNVLFHIYHTASHKHQRYRGGAYVPPFWEKSWPIFSLVTEYPAIASNLFLRICRSLKIDA